jgi:hypothetical protein
VDFWFTEELVYGEDKRGKRMSKKAGEQLRVFSEAFSTTLQQEGGLGSSP